MIVSLVVAASDNNIIGNAGQIPWHLPDDLRFFRTLTEGNPVIMGRKTYESIGRPLPKRLNIIVSRNLAYNVPGCTVVGSLPDALAAADMTGVPEAFVIGGGQLYEVAIPHADRVYLTRVHAEIKGDALFPTLDPKEWKETNRNEHAADERHPFSFTFLTYERIV